MGAILACLTAIRSASYEVSSVKVHRESAFCVDVEIADRSHRGRARAHACAVVAAAVLVDGFDAEIVGSAGRTVRFEVRTDTEATALLSAIVVALNHGHDDDALAVESSIVRAVCS